MKQLYFSQNSLLNFLQNLSRKFSQNFFPNFLQNFSQNSGKTSHKIYYKIFWKIYCKIAHSCKIFRKIPRKTQIRRRFFINDLKETLQLLWEVIEITSTSRWFWTDMNFMLRKFEPTFGRVRKIRIWKEFSDSRIFL